MPEDGSAERIVEIRDTRDQIEADLRLEGKRLRGARWGLGISAAVFLGGSVYAARWRMAGGADWLELLVGAWPLFLAAVLAPTLFGLEYWGARRVIRRLEGQIRTLEAGPNPRPTPPEPGPKPPSA